MALVPLIIRWGADTSSDRLRQSARCTQRGHRGATLQHPGWAGTHIGFQPFPVPAKRGVRRIARDLKTGVGTVLRIKNDLAA
jgi:hypothetical protein